MMPGTLEFQYDPVTDVMTIEGIHYHGDMFRSFGFRPTPADSLLRIIKREDGVVTVQEVRDRELVHRFDMIARAGGQLCG